MQALDRPPVDTREPEGRRAIPLLAIVVLTTLAFWALSSVGLLIYTAGTRAPATFELVIPAGTAEAAARGANPLELPATWSLYAGDLLTVDNRDTVLHQVGPWNFPPGQVYTIVLQPNFAGVFSCSFHPTGQIDLDVQPRGYDLRLTLIPTLMAGPALGLIAVGIRRVMRALDEPDEPDEPGRSTAAPPT